MPMIDLFDDGHCRLLYPIHLVEGVAQIRVGAFTQQERWARVEQDLLAQGWNGGNLCVNARWIPDAETANLILNQDLSAGANWNGVSLIRPGESVLAASQAPEFKGTPRFIGHANDLFTGLEDQIQRDLEWMSAAWSLRSLKVKGPSDIYGPQDRIWVSEDATIRAASLDTTRGVIVVGPGARVEPGSHIEGPVVLCEGAVVRTGAHIRGATVIGPHCKVGGEVSNVHFQGWANKAHGGFLGNSVIGRWCNLGAGTHSSNLKNTYGHVRQWSMASQAMEDSGLQFCGVLMGDHSKCGIGTTLNTGTILGPACVVFDAGFPPKHLPPFSWHDARLGQTERHDLPRMLATAETVMARRGQALTQAAKDNLSALYADAMANGASN